MKTHLLALTTIFGVAAAAGGCAPDGQSHASEAGPAAEAAIQEITIDGGDFFFRAPERVSAGLTRIRLVNVGAEFHHVQLVKLEDGHTLEDLLERIGAGDMSPPWASYVGGPNTPMPGGVTEATLYLEPGRYAMLCFIPSPDGIPHIMKGMVTTLTVTPTPGSAVPAEAAAEIRMVLDDYSYDFEPEIRAGRRTVRVDNVAEQPHEVIFVKLAPGKTLQDVFEFFHNEEGPPPFEMAGGTTLLTRGQSNVITVDFTPGEYALLCMVPDAKDGQPHVAHGMVRQITVR